jgi:hypothetical protein
MATPVAVRVDGRLELSVGTDAGAGRDDWRLRRAHEQFVTSGIAPPVVSALVLGSWRRSAGASVDPADEELPPVRMVSAQLEDYRQAHPLAVLLPLLRELLGDFSTEDGHIWAISDAAGVLLWVEGDRSVLCRAERMNFVPGAAWGEAQAGTNAPGTALTLGHAVQISGSEHYKVAAQPWSCSAVPVHDPYSGNVLGVVDISGDGRLATRQALTVVTATARAAEVELARQAALEDGTAREIYLQQLEGTGQPLALLTPRGQVLHTAPGVSARQLGSLMPGAARLSNGRPVVVERVNAGGYLLVCRADDVARRRRRTGTPLRLCALGTDTAELCIDGRTERLSRRHSEIIVALVLAEAGVTGERLGVDLYGDDIHPVTLRAELSRLRTTLGPDLLDSRPYQIRRPVRSDFHVVRDLLAAGQVARALAAYPGRLLPSSEAPAIVEFRTVLEQQLRAAVLASRDPTLLRHWVDSAWGADDAYAWDLLMRHLPAGSPQRAAAAARARALLD